MKLDSAELARLDAMAAGLRPAPALPGRADDGPTTLAALLAYRRARLTRG